MFPEARRLFLSSGHVNLSRLIPSDARWLETWVNDPVTTHYMATGRTPVAPGQLAAQIEAWKEPADWPFAIVLAPDDSAWGSPPQDVDPIGTVGLYGVDWLSRKAEFRILIGAPYCGKGHGTAATKAMVAFGFDRLNLHRIWLGVTSDNIRARIAYENAGFIGEGTLIDDLYRDGIYYHSTRMAITRPRYEEARKTWDTGKVKPATTSEPGPATAVHAVEPWTGFRPPAGG